MPADASSLKMNAEQDFPSIYVLGCAVCLETITGEEVQGEIFAFDKNARCFVLKGSGQEACKSNLRVLKAASVKRVVSLKQPMDEIIPDLPHIDINRCRDREAKAVQAAELEAARRGLGVTEEAQHIFDGLSRTMPCRWQGKTIIVLGEVSIREPYDISSVSTTHPGEGAIVDRVKKVLDAERKRLGCDL